MIKHSETVRKFYKRAVVEGRVEAAFEAFVSKGVVHHSTYGKADYETAIGHYKAFIADNPARSLEVVRTIEDGPLVFVHLRTQLGAVEQVYTDFFRFDDEGKIVEEWTVSSAYSASTPSGHTTTDGPTDINDLDRTDGNKQVVRNIIEHGLMPGGDPSRLPEFICEDYIQHNKDVADGRDHFLNLAAAPGRPLNYSQIELLLGEGNFAVTLCHASWTENQEITHFVQVDLFRLADGKAVEHWDNVEPWSEDA